MDYKHYRFLLDSIENEIDRQHNRFVISFADVDKRNLSQKELRARQVWSDIKYKEYQKEEYELRTLKNTLTDCIFEYTKKRHSKNKELIDFWKKLKKQFNQI
jgi:hypothetical protein